MFVILVVKKNLMAALSSFYSLHSLWIQSFKVSIYRLWPAGRLLRRYGYRLEEIHIKWTWKLFDIRRAAEEGVLFSPVNDSTLAWWLSWRKEGLNAPKILNFELQISEVRSLIEPIPDRLSVYCSNQTISRYLIARNWNVKKATKMLKDSLKWRLEYKPDEIRWVTFPLQTIYINLHIQVI